MKKSHLSYGFLGSFIGAVFVMQWVEWEGLVGFVSLLCLLGFVATFVLSIKRFAPLIIAIASGLFCAMIAVMHTTHVLNPTTVDAYIGKETVTLSGIISDVDARPTSVRYTIDTESLSQNGKTIAVHGKTLVTDLGLWPLRAYGDRVAVTGMLEHPQNTDAFDYNAYLSRYDIYSTMRVTRVAFDSAGHGNPLIAVLLSIKNRFEAQINSVFPEPEASFLAGLLTGSRRGLPDHVTQAFKQTGLTHIVAISGFNITIVITLIGSLLFFLPLRWRFVPTVLMILLFTLLVGASASVVRAAIMGILGLIALQTGRIANARLIILWTAFAMLLWNPKMLWDDAGFQLSFLAVIGLTECSELLKQLTKNIPNIFSVRDALMMTLAAQAFAMPWVIYIFGMLSVASPLANILVEPLVPIAMLFGFLGTTLSMISFPLGQMIAFPAWGLLHLIIKIAESLSAIPYASLQIPTVNLTLVALYYTVLIIAVIEYQRKRKIAGLA